MSVSKKPIPEGFAFKVMDSILMERLRAVNSNPKLKITNRWDQSDVFYNTRKKLDALGYDVSKLSERRKELNKHIKDWCDRLVWDDEEGNVRRGIKRHWI